VKAFNGRQSDEKVNKKVQHNQYSRSLRSGWFLR